MVLRRVLAGFAAFALSAATSPASEQSTTIPAQAIWVKGAWSSASGAAKALPEQGVVADDRYDNAYFGLSYPLGSEWTQRYDGPPPSDGGYYVLAQLEPRDPALNARLGHFSIVAQDLFFTSAPARSAAQFIDYYRDHLGDDYRVERAPSTMRLANRDFVRLDYGSPAAGLHWRVLATEIRCHVVEFVFTGADVANLDRQIRALNGLAQHADSGPVCIKEFANSGAVLAREDPIFTGQRFNQVPVRILIDKEGRVKHMHFLSAFPEQATSIADALAQWRFKPLIVDGQPVEVETGILFGRPAHPTVSALH